MRGAMTAHLMVLAGKSKERLLEMLVDGFAGGGRLVKDQFAFLPLLQLVVLLLLLLSRRLPPRIMLCRHLVLQLTLLLPVSTFAVGGCGGVGSGDPAVELLTFDHCLLLLFLISSVSVAAVASD